MSTHLSDSPTTNTNKSTATINTKTPTTALPLLSSSGNINGEDSNAYKFYPTTVPTYEEVVQNAELFMETLEDLHRSVGTKFMVPTIGRKALDLHRLFVEVTCLGGLEKVIRDRKWRDVVAVFFFPSTTTNASFVLRKYYISLLHRYEEIYYFRKQSPPISIAGSMTKSSVIESPTVQAQVVPPTPVKASSELHPGSLVSGTIDGKFDNGYLVTVSLGSDKLKGVLYHIPPKLQMPRSSDNSAIQNRRDRRRYRRRAQKDPSRPKSNRSGYNFFFAEHYTRLKPLHHGEEKVISKKIGHLWSSLTEAERQVYQEKGLRDKERYQNEMLEYEKSINSSKQ